MALTDTAIKAIKQEVRPKKYSDANGLFLLVQPNDSKLWRYAYRYLYCLFPASFSLLSDHCLNLIIA